MNRYILLAIGFPLISMLACEKPQSFSPAKPIKVKADIVLYPRDTKDNWTSLRDEPAFALVKGVVMGTNIFCDFEKLHKNYDEKGFELNPNEPILPDYAVLFGVKKGGRRLHDYRVLLGNSSPAGGWILDKDTGPTFHVSDGWGFFWNQAPVADTDWVCAEAEGTTMIIQVTPSVHRVYLIKKGSHGEQVKVVCNNATTYISDELTYREYDKSSCLTPQNPAPSIPAASADPWTGTGMGDFVFRARSMAERAGWSESNP